MAANIGRDIKFTATIKDDTKQGAESVKRNIGEAAKSAARAEREAKVFDDRRAARVVKRDTLQMQKDMGASAISDDELRREQIDRMNAESRRRSGGGGKGGGGGHAEGAGHLSRIFSDASTTGLDTLSRGLVGGISEKLGTGIQLGVLAVAGQSLSRLTEAAAQFGEELKKDNIDAAGLTLKIGETIPLIGPFVTAGQNIRELFTGEKAELERIKQFTEEILQADRRNLETSLQLLDTKKQHAAEVAKIQRDTAGTHLRGSQKEQYDISAESENERQQAAADIDKIKHDSLLKAKPAQDALRKFQDDGRAARLAKLDESLKTDPNDRKFFGRHLKERDELKAESDRLAEDARKEAKARQDQLAEDAGHRQKTADENINKNAERSAETRARNNEKIYGNEREAINRDEAMGDETAALAMRTAGRIAEAKQKEINSRADAEIKQSALDTERKKHETTDAHEREMLEAQNVAHIAAINEKRKGDLAQSEKELGVERRRAVYDAGQSVADAAAAGEAQRQREAGEGYKAREGLEKREHDRRLADIDQRAHEEITQNKDNAVAIRQKAEAEKAKENAEYKERQRQAGEEQRKGQFAIAKDLLAGQMDALNVEASAGNAISSREAKKLKVAMEYADKRAHLQDVMHDTHTTKEQKAIAQQQFDHLDEQQQTAERLAFFGGGFSLPSAKMAGRTTGLATKGSEEASREMQLHKLIQEGNKEAAATATNTKALLEAMKRNPATAALFRGGA